MVQHAVGLEKGTLPTYPACCDLVTQVCEVEGCLTAASEAAASHMDVYVPLQEMVLYDKDLDVEALGPRFRGSIAAGALAAGLMSCTWRHACFCLVTFFMLGYLLPALVGG